MSDVKYKDWRGIRSLHAAKLLKDTAAEIAWDTPYFMCGTSSLTRSTETSIAPKYYDNVPALNNRSVGPDEVEVEGSAIEDDVRAKTLGEYYDEENEIYSEGDREVLEHAMGYITKKTDGREWLVWRYRGTFGDIPDEHATEDDGTDSNGNNLTYSGLPTQHKFTKTGKVGRSVRCPLDKFPGGEEAWFAQVQTIDTVYEALGAAAANVETD